MNYEALLEATLSEARLARDEGTEPVGSVIATPEGNIRWTGRNRVRSQGDPTAHAEVDALRAAGAGLLRPPNNWILATSAEPCLMCLGAILVTPVMEVVWATAVGESAFTAVSGTRYASQRLAELRVVPEPSSNLRLESGRLLLDFYEGVGDRQLATRLRERFPDF